MKKYIPSFPRSHPFHPSSGGLTPAVNRSESLGEKWLKPRVQAAALATEAESSAELLAALCLQSLHIVINPLTTAGLVSGLGSIQLLLRYQRANPMAGWSSAGVDCATPDLPSNPSYLLVVQILQKSRVASRRFNALIRLDLYSPFGGIKSVFQ